MSDTEPASVVANGGDKGASLKEVPVATTVAPEETNGGFGGDAHEETNGADAEDSDEYDFEEDEQVVERDDGFVVGEEDYDDEERGDDGADYAEPAADIDAQAGATTNGQKPSLTALLLSDPNAGDEEEDDYEDDEDEDEEDSYIEESTPITPTSRKRNIEEALEDNVSPAPEEKGAKKIKA